MRVLFLNHAPSEAIKRDMGQLWDAAFIGPLQEVGLAIVKEVWTGPWNKEGKAPVDWSVLKECFAFRPDIVFIYGLHCYPEDSTKDGYISYAGIYALRKLLNTKVVAVVFDQAFGMFRRSDNLVMMCDWAITFEDENLFHGYSKYPDKHIVTLAPHSARLFNGDPATTREIAITFVGGTSGYKNVRAQAIAKLRANGIEVNVPGGRGNGQRRLTNQEYAREIHRSKIVINWSQHITGLWYHAKGRIFETTLAGSMLLCEECDAVNRWFEPHVDYVPFSTPEELVERAAYYLEHEKERLEIANRGHAKALARYSSDVVWQQRLSDLTAGSMYKEEEALESLNRNATHNELRVAQDLQRRGDAFGVQGQKIMDELLVIVERAHRSTRWRLQRAIPQLAWQVRRKRIQMRYRLMVGLRKIVPRSITRRSIANMVERLVIKTNK